MISLLCKTIYTSGQFRAENVMAIVPMETIFDCCKPIHLYTPFIYLCEKVIKHNMFEASRSGGGW